MKQFHKLVKINDVHMTGQIVGGSKEILVGGSLEKPEIGITTFLPFKHSYLQVPSKDEPTIIYTQA